MSAPRILQVLLATHAPLAALVAPARLFLGVVPQGTPLPAIGITEVSRTEMPTVSGWAAQSLVTARVQATVFSKSYLDQKTIIGAARLGPGPHTGLIADVSVLSVLRDIVGPDLSDEDAGVYQQSRDFIVKYIEHNAGV